MALKVMLTSDYLFQLIKTHTDTFFVLQILGLEAVSVFLLSSIDSIFPV